MKRVEPEVVEVVEVWVEKVVEEVRVHRVMARETAGAMEVAEAMEGREAKEDTEGEDSLMPSYAEMMRQ